MVNVVKPSRPYKNNYIDWLNRRFKEYAHHSKSLYICGKNFDIVHFHMTEEANILSRKCNVPCITSLHGTGEPHFKAYMILKFMAAIPRKTKYVAVSKNGYYQQQKFYKDDVIGYVHNCVDTNLFKYNPDPDIVSDIELLYVGRFVPEKGAHITIELVDRLVNEGIDVHLNMVGMTIPSYEKYYNKISSSVKNKKYITLKTNVLFEEVINSYQNSTGLLFPILWEEPFGYVLLESLSCGTPVIAFNRGSVSEIIRNKYNGYVCDNIEDMIESSKIILKINRENCRSTILNNFGIDKLYKHYMDKYEKIITDFHKEERARKNLR